MISIHDMLPIQRLEELVFTPIIKVVLAKYMDGMMSVAFSPIDPLWNLRNFNTACSTTCAKYDDLAVNTKEGVENALGRADTSDLRASFGRALSFSIPPLTLYRNYRPDGYLKLNFGVPLVDHEINEDNVPKVMRMCIEEIEKRGLNIEKLHWVSVLRTEACVRIHVYCNRGILHTSKEH